MRVGIIIYDSIRATTGGYIYDCKLVDYLKSQRVSVKVFSQPHKNICGLVRNNFSREIVNEIIEFSPDILLEDAMNFVSLFLLNKKLKRIGKFTIISIVHMLPSSMKTNYLVKLINKKIENIYFNSVNGYIFNSIDTKLSVMNIVGNDSNSIVGHPGKDRLKHDINEEDISFKSYDNKLMIVFVGNLSYNKGLHVLLQALSQIDVNLWRLSVIGGLDFDLKYSKKILDMITYLKLSDNVKFLGLLDVESLQKELVLHHVLAVPSYYESFGIVYAEAMGAGLPVIATQFGGAQEIVTDNINGFLVAPGNIEMLRNLIYKLIKDRELLIKMSLSSLSAYRNMASWDDTMERVYDFLSRQLF